MRIQSKLSVAIILAVGSASFASVSLAQSTVLYDTAGSLTPDQSPWGWTYQAIGPVSPTFSGGATQLDTSASDAYQAGFARFTPNALNASLGYTVRFDLKTLSEDHSNSASDKNSDGLSDRAGIAVIVLGSDHKGVELDFWQNEIWAQQISPIFTHSQTSERGFLDTTAAGTGVDGLDRYDLKIIGNSYSLFANGASSALLTGLLKDYSAGPIIYSSTNFLFIGDNNTTTRGSFQLSHVEAIVAPEPGSIVILGIASGLLTLGTRAIRHSTRRKKRSV